MLARSVQYLRTLAETGLPHVSQRAGPIALDRAGRAEYLPVLPSLQPHQHQKHHERDPGRPKLREVYHVVPKALFSTVDHDGVAVDGRVGCGFDEQAGSHLTEVMRAKTSGQACLP